jgi:Rod binding domain-containing protein
VPIQNISALSRIHSAPTALFDPPSHALAASGSKDSAEKIQKAATDFEALLIAQMIKSARESGGGMTGDSDEQDETNATLVELGEQQMAQALSNSGGLGIAKMVIAGLTNHANR